MKRFFLLLLICYLLCFAVSLRAGQVSVETMPPSVVKTVPRAGDTKVDPSLTEVRVTFSKDMMTNNQWSWCQYSPGTFPQIDKTKIRYLQDKRTCILPVKLKPGKTYIIWVNTQKYNYFKDKNGNSAVPYLLVFQTRATTWPGPHTRGEAISRFAAGTITKSCLNRSFCPAFFKKRARREANPCPTCGATTWAGNKARIFLLIKFSGNSPFFPKNQLTFTQFEVYYNV